MFDRAYFDAGVARVGTDCEKWDGMIAAHGDADMIPMWVADMDFRSAPAIEQALAGVLAWGTWGYTMSGERDAQALCDFWARRHGVHIAPQEVLSGEYRTVSTVTDPFADAKQIEKQLIEHVYSHKKAEIAAKSCLSGPHKDDLELLLDGRSAASFGSQGQVRTCTLSLKLAERELFFSEDGEYPVLLLDDVLSELDRRRQDFVLNRISAGQVMITCCEDGISEKLRAGAVFAIKNGKII